MRQDRTTLNAVFAREETEAMSLTRKQKADIAAALVQDAGNIAEFWAERGLGDIPRNEGVDYLASIVRRFPGDAWDTRLGSADCPNRDKGRST